MRAACIFIIAAPLAMTGCALLQPSGPTPVSTPPAPQETAAPATQPVVCPPPTPAVEDPNPEAARHAVESAMQAYAAAVHSGPPKAIASRFTAEGELQLPDLAALHGRKAILDFLTPLTETSEISSVKMRSDLIEVHGSSASQWGVFDQDAGERGKRPVHNHGRYAALWRLEADGNWRLERLMMQTLEKAQ